MKTIEVIYTNHRGETRLRRLTPFCLWFGRSPYHNGEQWFVNATDEEDRRTPGRLKDFALLGFRGSPLLPKE